MSSRALVAANDTGPPRVRVFTLATAPQNLRAPFILGSANQSVGFINCSVKMFQGDDCGDPTTPEAVDVFSVPVCSSQWVGSKSKSVEIGGTVFSLSHVLLGVEGSADFAEIDSQLSVADSAGPLSGAPQSLTSYRDFDPTIRRAYLEWIVGGRISTEVPGCFLLLHLYSLEQVIVRRCDRSFLGQARVELKRLMTQHAKEKQFCYQAEELVALCDWLDPTETVTPIPASAQANHRPHMPFDVRVYVGQLFKNSTRLEADAALLFVLQQPGTRLDSRSAQAFDLIYHRWVEEYPYRFADGLEICPSATISFHYDCLDEAGAVEFPSDVPDPATVELPTQFQLLFDECCGDLDQLDGLSIEQRASAIRQLKHARAPSLNPAWGVRADAPQRISTLLAGPGPVKAQLRDVLSDLFENAEAPVEKQLEVRARRWLTRELGELGVGFEPDERYGLPSSLRVESNIVLFREDPDPTEEPSDAFHLAQAALVLSALGITHYPGLRPLNVLEIEQRLLFRHRFSDRELRRLEATFLAMLALPDPRSLIAKWPRLMTRHKRVRDIEQGFGIAFYGQEGRQLERFARAISLALHGDDRRVAGFLNEVKAQMKLDEAPHEHRPTQLGGRRELQAIAFTPRYQDRTATPFPRPKSRIQGLSAGEADILIALLERARNKRELVEIATARQLQLAGALERINEWSREEFGLSVTRGRSLVRINPDLYEAIQQRVDQQ